MLGSLTVKRDIWITRTNLFIVYRTGETASILGGLHLFGPCQYIGLDINLDFIQHATINYRWVYELDINLDFIQHATINYRWVYELDINLDYIQHAFWKNLKIMIFIYSSIQFRFNKFFKQFKCLVLNYYLSPVTFLHDLNYPFNSI